MHLVSTLFSALARITFRLVLLTAALVFILGLLSVALVSVTGVLLKALLTGRKPAFVTTFTRFRQASRQFRSGEWPARGGAGFGRAAPGEVMDVQAHEIRDAPALPCGPTHDKP